MTSRPLTLGIAGGSGSGKSTAAERVLRTLGESRVARLAQDAYYRDAEGLPLVERAARNYDHPEAVDEPLLLQHIRALQAGHAVEAPLYDFERHERRRETVRVEPRPCLLVEGILILASPALREVLDLRLFVETDADVRLARRLRRDVQERGRTAESVLAQWEATVRPMHLLFVEPSKRYADLIIPEGGLNSVALDVLLGHLRDQLGLRGAPGETQPSDY
jgi:uridine kinase